MVKTRGTRGKQQVIPFSCPICGGEGEQQIGRDFTCPPKQTKVTQLCYSCGYSKTFYEPVHK